MTTEQTFINTQEKSGNKDLYLFKVGGFYHAVNGAAFALQRITGYQVRKQHRKAGDNFLLGFPIQQLAEVKEKMKGADMKYESLDPTENTILFHGGDPSENLDIVVEDIDLQQDEVIKVNDVIPSANKQARKKKPANVPMEIMIKLIRLDVANMTPMEAITTLAELKKMALTM